MMRTDFIFILALHRVLFKCLKDIHGNHCQVFLCNIQWALLRRANLHVLSTALALGRGIGNE